MQDALDVDVPFGAGFGGGAAFGATNSAAGTVPCGGCRRMPPPARASEEGCARLRKPERWSMRVDGCSMRADG